LQPANVKIMKAISVITTIPTNLSVMFISLLMKLIEVKLNELVTNSVIDNLIRILSQYNEKRKFIFMVLPEKNNDGGGHP